MKTAAALMLVTLLVGSCGPRGSAAPEATTVATPTSTPTASAEAADAATKAIFAPYLATGGADPHTADWDRPVFSAATAALIAKWKKGFQADNVIALQDFGWFCECQDWDAAKFKVEIVPHGAPSNGRIEVTAKVDAGFGEPRTMRFVLIDEGGTWKIDDIRAEWFEGGLRAAFAQARARLL